MPAAGYKSYVQCLRAQLAEEPDLDTHFHSRPGGFSGNRAEMKEAEVCFSTTRALEGDFHDQPGEKGPLRKYKSGHKVLLNYQQWPCLCYKLGIGNMTKSSSQTAIAKASSGKMKSLIFSFSQGRSTCACQNIITGPRLSGTNALGHSGAFYSR